MNIVGWATRWPNFSPEEILSPQVISNGVWHKLDPAALDELQRFRTVLGEPLIVNFGEHVRRGVRTYRENRLLHGAAEESMHSHGRAFDIHCPTMSISELYEAILQHSHFTGVGKYTTFIHVDNRFTNNGEKTLWINKR